MSLRERLIAEGVLRPGQGRRWSEDAPTPQPWREEPTVRIEPKIRAQAEREARQRKASPALLRHRSSFEDRS